MAISKSKVFITLLLVSLLVLDFVGADHHQDSTLKFTVVSTSDTNSPLLDKIDCGGACTARCRLSSRPRLCKRACGTCCFRCKCVPPGTAGNLEMCPCYANQTTHGGKRKCP